MNYLIISVLFDSSILVELQVYDSFFFFLLALVENKTKKQKKQSDSVKVIFFNEEDLRSYGWRASCVIMCTSSSRSDWGQVN